MSKQQAGQWVGRVLGGVLALGVVCGSAGHAQGASDNAKDDLFAGTEKFAQGATNVSEISMDPDSLGLVDGRHAHQAHRMVLNVVRSYEYDKPGMYRMEDVDAFRKKLETGDWHCSVHTRDLKRGGSTDVCNKHRTDGMVESAIITVEPRSLTFIHTIRKAGDDQSHQGMPVISGDWDLTTGAHAVQLAMLGPQMEVQMAKLQAMQPILQARMAAIGPEIEARMAGMRARMEAEGERMRSLQQQPPPAAHRLPIMPRTPVAPRAPGQPE